MTDGRLGVPRWHDLPTERLGGLRWLCDIRRIQGGPISRLDVKAGHERNLGAICMWKVFVARFEALARHLAIGLRAFPNLALPSALRLRANTVTTTTAASGAGRGTANGTAFRAIAIEAFRSWADNRALRFGTSCFTFIVALCAQGLALGRQAKRLAILIAFSVTARVHALRIANWISRQRCTRLWVWDIRRHLSNAVSVLREERDVHRWPVGRRLVLQQRGVCWLRCDTICSSARLLQSHRRRQCSSER